MAIIEVVAIVTGAIAVVSGTSVIGNEVVVVVTGPGIVVVIV